MSDDGLKEGEKHPAPKGKFSAADVLSHVPEKSEGLLEGGPDTEKKKKKGGRPALSPEEKKKMRFFYMNDEEWRQFIRWCDGVDGSNAVRTLIKRAMGTAENYYLVR